MKNRRRPSRQNPNVTLPSKGCVSFAREFMRQLPTYMANLKMGSLEQPLKATINVFYQSYRSDVDVEYVYDLLQEAGVVANDRYIRVKHVDGRFVDKNNPRVEITIEEL